MSLEQAPARTTCFPEPSAPVRLALMTWRLIRGGDPDALAEAAEGDDPPRPWAPDTCAEDMAQQVWQWCDDVALWVNREYAWRPAGLIPGCWPHHAHIARELPVLACLHHAAAASNSPEPLEEWHRHSLPLFLDRLHSRLGEGTCVSGKHQPWPAAARYDAAVRQSAAEGREQQR